MWGVTVWMSRRASGSHSCGVTGGLLGRAVVEGAFGRCETV